MNWTNLEFIAALRRAYVPRSKTTVFYNREFYSQLVRYHLKRIDPPKLMKERFFLESRVLTMRPHHFMFDILNKKLQQYVEADLIQQNSNLEYGEDNPKKYEKYAEPFAILKLGELEAGFVVWMVPLLFSIIVFTLEWIPTLKDLIVFLFIFKKYYDLKESEWKNQCELMKIKFTVWQALATKTKQGSNGKLRKIDFY